MTCQQFKKALQVLTHGLIALSKGDCLFEDPQQLTVEVLVAAWSLQMVLIDPIWSGQPPLGILPEGAIVFGESNPEGGRMAQTVHVHAGRQANQTLCRYLSLMHLFAVFRVGGSS